MVSAFANHTITAHTSVHTAAFEAPPLLFEMPRPTKVKRGQGIEGRGNKEKLKCLVKAGGSAESSLKLCETDSFLQKFALKLETCLQVVCQVWFSDLSLQNFTFFKGFCDSEDIKLSKNIKVVLCNRQMTLLGFVIDRLMSYVALSANHRSVGHMQHPVRPINHPTCMMVVAKIINNKRLA